MEHALQVEYRSPDDLTPYARNARTHSPEQVAQIAGSIREFGFTNPILTDENGTIIAGHGRLAAAQKLGLEKVPCITIAGLTDTQRRALILADNRLAETAGWDAEMLRVELEELTEAGADLDMIGFDEESLDELIGGLEDEHTEGDTEPEEPPAKPVSRRGDVWQLGKHRLMCGDSTSADDIDALTQKERCALLLTDPPYGVSIVKGSHVCGASPVKFGTTTREYAKSIVSASVYAPIIGDESTQTARDMYALASSLTDFQVIFGGNYFTDFLPPSRCWFVWDKGFAEETPFAQCELAWVSKDGNARLFKRLWAGLCREGDRSVEGVKRVHPTQKPVSLCEDILGEFPDANTVLDLFGGSGSTLIACEKTGRVCRMMELSPHYCDVIVKRWQDFTGQKAMLESDGKTFDEVAQERAQ